MKNMTENPWCASWTLLPIECIVRGYIIGKAAGYQENGTVCGIKLPEGLKESDKLPNQSTHTPSNAEIGRSWRTFPFEQSADHHLENTRKGRELAEKLRGQHHRL